MSPRDGAAAGSPRVRMTIVLCTAGLLCLGGLVDADADKGNSKTYTSQSGLLDAGGAHTCAVTTTRKVRCWGYGASGQLGSNDNATLGDGSPSPEMAGLADLPLPADVGSITAGGNHTCALLVTRKVRCWGDGGNSRLGNNSPTNIADNNTSHKLQDASDVPLPDPVDMVTAGGAHTCALMVTGNVRCWGAGANGALGTDDTGDVGYIPDADNVDLPDDATAISAGGANTCAILVTGKLWCWGQGADGKNGSDAIGDIGDNGGAGSIQNASDVPLPDNVAGVSVGSGRHTCAVLVTGKVRCWGLGTSGQLGNNSTANIGDNDTTHAMDNASDVPLPADAAAVAVGNDHTCALLTTGKVRCWGSGALGQLGNDSTANIGDNNTTHAMLPGSDVPLPANAVAIAAGGNHSCALLTTGKVRCWGQGGFGATGHDSADDIGDGPGEMSATTDLNLPNLQAAPIDLSLKVSAPVTQLAEQGSTGITLTLRNAGSAGATGVTVLAPAPSGMTVTGDTPSQGSYSGQLWNVGAVAAGTTKTLTLTVKMPNGFAARTANYEVLVANGAPDVDSTPNNSVDGEDDRDTLSLEEIPAPADESPPANTPVYQFNSKFGALGPGNGQFAQPWDVAVDPASSPYFVWVSDFGNDRIQEFRAGVYQKKFEDPGSGLGQLDGPKGIAYRNNRAYVVDTGGQFNPRVQVYDTSPATPTYDTTFGTAGSNPDNLNIPSDVEVNSFNGHLYVTDDPGGPPHTVVKEYASPTSFTRQFGSGFSGFPEGVASNPKTGKVYVVDPDNDRIRVYDLNGDFVADFGTFGTGDGEFDAPTGVAVDPVNHVVFVADSGNSRIQLFSLNGDYLAQFGTAGSGNGQLNSPRGMAVAPDGSLFVADTGNNRVQVFKPAVFEQPPPPPPPPGGGGGVTPPPPSCTGGASLQNLSVGVAKFYGCMTKLGTTYRATSPILFSGVPVSPSSGKALIVETDKTKGYSLSVQDEGAAQLTVAGIPIFKGSGLKIKIPDKNGTNLLSLPAQGSIYGLKLKGKFSISLGRTSDKSFVSFGLQVALPDVIKYADDSGGVSGDVAVRVEEDGKVNSNGAKFTVSGLRLGPLTVETACFALVPSGSSVEECGQPVPHIQKLPLPQQGNVDAFLTCKPDETPGDHWSAALALQLPTPSQTRIGVYGSGNGPNLRSLGGFGTNLNIELTSGVTLETLGAGVCLPGGSSPELAIKGTVGIGLVSIVQVNGSLTYRGTSQSNWSLRFDGDVSISKGDFGRIGTGGIQVYSNGSFGANVAVTTRIAGFLSLTGDVTGGYSTQTKAYFVEGGVTLCPIGTGDAFCLGARAIVSNIGIAGCARGTTFVPGLGIGYFWADKSTKVIGGTCDLGEFRPKIARVAGANRPLKLVVPVGTKTVAFRVAGAAAPPGLQITGPSGYKVDLKQSVPLARTNTTFVLQNPRDRTTNVVLGNLRPGTYLISPGASALRSGARSAQNGLTRLDVAPVYASFSGRGRVKSARGGRKTLDLRYVQPTGASISLMEKATRGKQVIGQSTIVKALHGRACPGRKRQVAGGKELCARVSFTPGRGPAGPRQIVAVVTRGGQPVSTEAVASYRASAPKPPSRPAKVQLRRSGTTVTVRFSPSAGAARYAVVARTTTGAPRSGFFKAGCRGVVFRNVKKADAVTVSVAGVRYDSLTGRVAKAALKAKKPSGGRGGRALRGRLCR